ncbi:MAG: efflux RND transporter periplasmic adaptor subunit [candidate division KSB1 bacterium]|nr:efflux RND transporter periplasmic adaptor subunit [candidate division KSB1 bacterium]MDZ7273092.1 efflux RND transporter periplasmic adaptor subunit [candidate division KSB1 bacterium]MDZ7285195.1 efflux RND transporter periplasmic adaptor subunit [candidate division KSB1 bacterium]MDZ7298227.1 efflux RND transporter periplasmic adaptor subunit [candidate division KSB1 bacterium]MDZ7306729.1 efflux RND transporter periplasmic adaptor subunit [candidate division KSB1 bacterium]
MKKAGVCGLVVSLWLAGCGNNEEEVFQASAIVEGTAVKVSAQTGGLLLQVNFEEGDVVERGQILAVIDTEKLGYQREQIEASLEELAIQQRLAATNVRRAAEDYEYAKTKHDRYLELFQQNAASQQVLDDLKLARERTRTALEAAQQNQQSLASRNRSLTAQLKLLQRQINDASVTAPISGTVATRYYEAGETIPMHAPLAELIDLSTMWAKVYVSETFLSKIKIGQPAEIRPDGVTETLRGTVSWISPRAEFTPKNILTPESRTALVYAVKVTIPNPGQRLKHGMPVTITLPPAW